MSLTHYAHTLVQNLRDEITNKLSHAASLPSLHSLNVPLQLLIWEIMIGFKPANGYLEKDTSNTEH